MKKILLVLALLAACSIGFSEVFKDGDKIVENFWNNGNYIKIIKNENNICYFYKPCIAGINIDEDDMEIATMGYNIWSGKNEDTVSYNIKRWKIISDENGNIIITK